MFARFRRDSRTSGSARSVATGAENAGQSDSARLPPRPPPSSSSSASGLPPRPPTTTSATNPLKSPKKQHDTDSVVSEDSPSEYKNVYDATTSASGNNNNSSEEEKRALDEEAKKMVRRPSLARRLSNSLLLRRKSSTSSNKSPGISSNEDAEDAEEHQRYKAKLAMWGRGDYGQLMRDVRPAEQREISTSGTPSSPAAGDEAETLKEVKEDGVEAIIGDQGTREFESGVSQFSVGLFHSIVTTNRGNTWGAGDNEDGQLDKTQPTDFFNGAKPIRGSETLIGKKSCSVSVGLKHSALVTSDGLVLTWGSNESGQLGHSKDASTRIAPRQLDGNVRRERGVQVACSEGATFILTEKGQVWSTGEGTRGELGRPETLETGCSWMASPVLGSLFCTPVSMISAGAAHVVAVSVTGKAFGWGWNRHGQLGFKPKSEGKRFEPSPIALSLECASVKMAACGSQHTVILASDGKLYSAGSNDHGQLGRAVEGEPHFSQVTNILEVLKVACGSYHTVALLETGKVYGWGSNEFGEIKRGDNSGTGGEDNVLEPYECVSKCALDINCGGRSTAVLMLLDSSASDEEFKRRLHSRVDSTIRLHGLDARMLLKLVQESNQTNSLSNLKGAVMELHATGLNRSFLDKSEMSKSRVDVDGVVESLGEVWKTMVKKKDGEKLLWQRLSQLHQELLDLATVATEPDQLRAFFIALLNPACEWMPSQHYASLVKACASLSEDSLDLIAEWAVKDCSPEIFANNFLKQLLRVVDFAAARRDWSARGCAPAAVRVLSKLYQQSSTKQGFVSFDKFYAQQPTLWAQQTLIEEWRRYVRRDRDTRGNDNEFSIFDHPFILSAETKRSVIMFDQQNAQIQNAVMTALTQNGSPFFEITVRREYLLQDALGVLLRAKKADLVKPMRVTFEGEPGMDWGGLRKELFELLSAVLFDPKSQDFFYIPDPDNHPSQLWLNARGKTAELIGQMEALQEKRKQRLLKNRSPNTTPLLFVADCFNCPKGCQPGLQPYTVPNNSFSCDVCGCSIALGAHTFSCRICNYDVCNDCREEDVPDVTNAWKKVVLVGALMGLSLYNSTLIDVHFPLALYAGLLDRPIKNPTLDDLRSIDTSLAKGLQQMLDMPADDPDMFNDLFEGQFFSLPDIQRELEPGGSSTQISLENRARYVKKRCEFEVRDGVAPLLEALLTGFKSVVDVHGDAMSLFSPPELELLIVGVSSLDFTAWESTAKYEGFEKDSTVIRWFWDICQKELTEPQKQKLAAFVTGSSKAPIGGLATQSIILQRAGPDSDRLPTAHTCFNTLLLQDYSTKEKLRERLEVAIGNAQGFGLQ